MIQTIVGKILGTRNDKLIKKYQKCVNAINTLESSYKNLSDDELKSAFEALKQKVKDGASLDSVLEASFAITREASVRTLGMRHFDVQLIGGMVLNDGKIAEMKTGEGKTLVATLAVSLNAMRAQSVHVVTVNDYLANRDANEMMPLYNFLGYSVGVITSNLKDDATRLEVYANDIVYGTNNEFGFDYLRDNMKYDLESKVQKCHFYAIIDEVDSILIDEARTPLIISGPVNKKLENYQAADLIAKKMETSKDFSIDEKNRVILITEEGIKKAENLFKIENLYSIENAALSHHLDQALKANYLFSKDKDYVVQNGEVIIVDEFTGRLSEGRRFSEGLHQALEAKEKVNIKEESQTLADITFQNYFRLYEKLAGMTGTAQTEATEFLQIYNLEVVSIPTNVPIKRQDLNDLIYKSEREKFNAVIAKIKELHAKGQPVLVGTASIEKSEILHNLLKKEKIAHTVLNAKQHTKEAEIIKDAGLKGSVTIATNMAGRGVDIKIDDEIKELGGLYIIGTERHESRRIDNQLRGRAGRQGDPGVSQFYLSLEDALLRIFGSDKLKGIMEKLGLKEGEHIESSLVTRSVQNAQKKVENLHFESRKHLLEYDDVANEQRKSVYKFRNELLDPDYDMIQRIQDNRSLALAQTINKIRFQDEHSLELDTNALIAIIKEEFGLELESEALSKINPAEIEEYINHQLTNSYEEKMSHLPPQQRNEIERIIYLQILDNLWREHLYAMDTLKTGIGLRGYNQKDPLVEYKKESYNLFMELVEQIKIQAVKTLHIIRLQAEENPQNQTQEIIHDLKAQDKNLSFNKDEIQQNLDFEAKKISRNDPCPCGSGKKYKLCHGRSGPKKGMLAQ
ncbi:preprotein translocase subunit SecA [Helicobacter fennelliae]|mgnify:CR=1 FL=1|uniref:Protein translocase subunit SecA n=1 Tax=Helicobacter fennelliae MRY12-0050 TaxID=1325130 RepID=T1CZ17_9HELI|nr:preprotein translocase subunit SecA [Helicobacter fennelliae]GAD18201.1 protein export cytoplasm protein SecA ATPase RNA helicase [Helicobacter fennelliae MRY12-0050]STP06785.1 preprotein translocase subunit [Helicobacter fennelliae]STQ83661.1 preprotein translocase subunit [Helicobacter fennelliae]